MRLKKRSVKMALRSLVSCGYSCYCLLFREVSVWIQESQLQSNTDVFTRTSRSQKVSVLPRLLSRLIQEESEILVKYDAVFFNAKKESLNRSVNSIE